VVSTIPVGQNPVAVAVNPVTNQIYVANFSPYTPTTSIDCGIPPYGSATVIDGTTESTTTINLQYRQGPFAVAVNSATDKAYVVSWGEQNIKYGGPCSHGFFTTIDGATLKASEVELQSLRPQAIAVNEATGSVYIAASDGSVNGTIRVGSNPSALAVNPTTNKVYVTNLGSNNVSVIDGATNKVTTLADPNAIAPVGVAVNPETNRIYVANQSSNNVSIIDGAADSIITVADPHATSPRAVAVNSRTNKIYVVNSGSNNATVIDGATNAVVTVVVGVSPVALAVNPDTNQIFVANAGNAVNPGSVTVIDGETNSTTTLIDPNALIPSAVAVHPATDKAYVANSGSNNVTVINGAAGTSNLTLSVTLAGSGVGTVASNPPAIYCGSSCAAIFAPGTSVTITAAPSSTSNFAGWDGACSGTGTCNVTMNASVSVTANFMLKDFSVIAASKKLTVQRGGQGTDTLTIAGMNGPFGATIELSCAMTGPSSMPTCALSPSSVTPGANPATSTLTITAPGLSAQLTPFSVGWRSGPLYAVVLTFPGLAIIGYGMAASKSKKRRSQLLLLCGLSIAFIALQAGCGGGSSGQQLQPQTYTITVTATSGTITHTTKVTLSVQ
jgi:YVTN family beta-propeller protein